MIRGENLFDAMRFTCTFLVVLCLGALLPSFAEAQTSTSLRLLQSDADRVVLELQVAGYDARVRQAGGATYTALAIPDLGNTDDAGKPQLPVKGVMIGVPRAAQVSLKIVADESRRDALAYPPLPASTPRVQYDPRQALPNSAGNSVIANPVIYSGSSVYPADAVRIASIGNWRSQRYAVLEFRPVQYDPRARQLILHRRLRVEIAFSYASGARGAAQVGEPVGEGAFESLLQKSLVNYDSAKNWRSAPQRLPAPRTSPRYDGSPWYKIPVDSDGMYQITCEQLASSGIDLGALDPRTLKIFKSGAELAIDAIGQTDGHCDAGDYYEFFGQAARTKYTNTNLYWLTYGGAAGKRMTTRDAGGAGTPTAAFTNTIHLEQDKLFRSYLPLDVEGADHWYWNYLAPASGVPSVDYAFQATNPINAGISPTAQIALYAYSANGHHTQIFVNGNLIDDSTWMGQVERRVTIPFAWAYLNSGANTLRVTELNDLDANDVIFTNYFDVSYTRAFVATNDALRFGYSDNGTWQYQITGFSSAALEAFDIADPFNVVRLSNASITPAPCPCTLQFADAVSSPREYIALAAAQRKTPASITLDSASNLPSTSNGADYVVISYGAFIPSVQSLANFRAAQGLRVKVVDVQDVYDEFGDGLMDAQAIRDFLAYAYANWQSPKPAFVLLVGDGNFDFKNNLGSGEANYIPPFLRMVDPWLGETASDNRFVSFGDGAGNPLPQMAIGRLPAGSAADVSAMVAKILTYEQNPPAGDWRNKIAFVADRAFDTSGTPDAAGNFWTFSDAVASNPQYIRPPVTADRIYYNPCALPQCGYTPYLSRDAARTNVFGAINDGRLIVNYVGHAGITVWSKDDLYRADSVRDDLNLLSNGGKLPVVLAMTCYDGYFHYPGFPGLAERQVRLEGRGALASWSASGLGVATGHDFLDRGFFQAVFQDGMRQIGPAAVAGKMNLWLNSGGANLDLIDTFNLLGDPASRLAITDYRLYLPIVLR